MFRKLNFQNPCFYFAMVAQSKYYLASQLNVKKTVMTKFPGLGRFAKFPWQFLDVEKIYFPDGWQIWKFMVSSVLEMVIKKTNFSFTISF